MFCVYILYSEKDKGYYVGSTGNLTDRVERHLSGRSLATKNRRPLKLVYMKEHLTRKEAIRAELHIKKQKSRKHIEKLIANNNDKALVAQLDRASAF